MPVRSSTACGWSLRSVQVTRTENAFSGGSLSGVGTVAVQR
jgi:hypothetical protein